MFVLFWETAAASRVRKLGVFVGILDLNCRTLLPFDGPPQVFKKSGIRYALRTRICDLNGQWDRR
jgi:hypothetical protein